MLAAKSLAALAATGRSTLVVAGGVGANLRLRARLRRDIGARGGSVHFPDAMFCTDNGAMIALAGALRIADARAAGGAFDVMPRWELPDTQRDAGRQRDLRRGRDARRGRGSRPQRPMTRSSPCTSLRMLSLWRQNSSNAMTTVTHVTASAPTS